ncbi:EF-hand domain-containing protein [Vibrio algarum]|uniref:EF-hand domain-containing protein n=1 Tax=Vibrio algarum TaxID=3020714 RepID=A0ABT4YWV2_9VIBR|nr:hypothetical protein [Vibrio sp. KJ40-1]MDB1126056.1 hypothetical protein [Vibrio sp. KJ40-1]
MKKIIPVRTAITALAGCVIGLTTLFAFANSDAPEGQMPPSFEQMDANGDKQLSLDEVKGPLADDFDRFDKNGDGYLSQDELPPPPGQGERPQ